MQTGYLTYCDPRDHTEYEIPWDKLILSPRRSVGLEATRIANILGLECEKGKFLEVKGEKVRPEQVGRDEMYLAGSARYPCDLHETLRQGRRAAAQTAELVEKARKGDSTPPGWSARLTRPFVHGLRVVQGDLPLRWDRTRGGPGGRNSPGGGSHGLYRGRDLRRRLSAPCPDPAEQHQPAAGGSGGGPGPTLSEG